MRSAAPVGSSSGHASAIVENRRAARAYRGGWSVRRHAAAPHATCGYRTRSRSSSTSDIISARVSSNRHARSAAACAERAETTRPSDPPSPRWRCFDREDDPDEDRAARLPNPEDPARENPSESPKPRITLPPSAAAAAEHIAARSASHDSWSSGTRSAARTRADAAARGNDAARNSHRRASSAHCSRKPGSNTSASGRRPTRRAMASGDQGAPPSLAPNPPR